MKRTYFFYFIIFLAFSRLYSQKSQIFGVVIDKENSTPLQGVNITAFNAGVATDLSGKFSLTTYRDSILTFSYIGYETINIKPSNNMVVVMNFLPLIGDPIEVNALRAQQKSSPISFSNLTVAEIKTRYTAQDIPMVLATEPGIWAYSESGNGVGYSYISIRGFDQSKIGVMVDGVPLNDNESHQVYWVDHGDLLADAKDVQIQRGIGSNLYGSSSFGGSIQVNTQIQSKESSVELLAGYGSFNTRKNRLKYLSGKDLGENLSMSFRASSINSDGYREFHDSQQKGMSLGLEHRGSHFKNQFRALIGYENTQLTWDGVHKDDIEDLNKRRSANKAYTDDFIQQIFSLNTSSKITENFHFRNTSYLVLGKGYYETSKTDQDFYSYSLDINNELSDSDEKSRTTDLLRRKWIDNNYYGFVPVFTIIKGSLRMDMGASMRLYKGDHYGKIKNFSDSTLQVATKNTWYRYYQYIGKKNIMTPFSHFVWQPENQPFTVTADFQNQKIDWNLDQAKIGHAAGHQLSADWNFFNPRMGMLWEISDSLSWYVNIGKAQKEPADNQIISADDVFSKPVMAAAEVVSSLELGLNIVMNRGYIKLNGYRIDYLNEQLKNIDINQEGEYDYYYADSTTHSGFEWEGSYIVSPNLSLSGNGALIMNLFNSGESLPNIPSSLLNLFLTYRPFKNTSIFAHANKVGGMYINNPNTDNGYLEGYALLSLGVQRTYKNIEILLKVDNIFNTLYSTYGYGYEYDGYQAYLWPGATRNSFINVSYAF